MKQAILMVIVLFLALMSESHGEHILVRASSETLGFKLDTNQFVTCAGSPLKIRTNDVVRETKSKCGGDDPIIVKHPIFRGINQATKTYTLEVGDGKLITVSLPADSKIQAEIKNMKEGHRVPLKSLEPSVPLRDNRASELQIEREKTLSIQPDQPSDSGQPSLTNTGQPNPTIIYPPD